jgi:hypothetical protein
VVIDYRRSRQELGSCGAGKHDDRQVRQPGIGIMSSDAVAGTKPSWFVDGECYFRPVDRPQDPAEEELRLRVEITQLQTRLADPPSSMTPDEREEIKKRLEYLRARVEELRSQG